jgi:Holliday junction resolvasome RuvABC endonuclease subunit
MKILGIHLAKSQLRYAVLEGTADSPTLVAKDRLVTVDPSDVPALMDWFDTQFRALLDQHQPDKISYRLTLDPKKDQLFSSEFPLGILNLLAHQRGLPIVDYTPRSFVGSKLGLKKGTDLIEHCDGVFGKHPPYWDKNQKYAILVAWFELP